MALGKNLGIEIVAIIIVCGVAGWWLWMRPPEQPAAAVPPPTAPPQPTTPVPGAPPIGASPAAPAAPATAPVSALLSSIDPKSWEGRSAELRTLLAGGPLTAADQVEALLQELVLLADTKVFAPTGDDPAVQTIVVQGGDTLIKLGAKHGVNHRFIMRLSGLKDTALNVGQRLRVLPGELSVDVYKSRFKLLLWHEGRLLRAFPAGIGREDRTPLAEFTVKDLLPHPEWHYEGKIIPYGDPKNILGTHWIGLANAEFKGFGIHGTWKEESVGTAASLGCVRLRNADVEQLYDLLRPGLAVRIHP